MLKTLIAGRVVLAALVFSVPMLAQQQPGSSGSTEFPVTMRQNIDAGKTSVGTKIQTKLVVATLVNGVVIPRDAVFSGEVTESVAKTKTEPSRLSVRIDSAQWKNGSTTLKLYLTPWYYPPAPLSAQDLSYQSMDAAKSPRNWNGMGTYPDPNNEMSQKKFPGRDDDRDAAPPAPDALGSNISKHRLLMKDVDTLRGSEGTVILSSKKSNLKLDKSTTYVLSGSDLLGSR